MGALRQECIDCGFVYDPADYGGASLFDLDDWDCPNCGTDVGKFDFARNEDTTVAHTVSSNLLAVKAIEASEGKSPDLYGIEISRLGLLRTPAGNVVSSTSDALLLHMIRELEEHPILHVEDQIITEPRPLCAYLLFSTQRDFIELSPRIDRDAIAHRLEHDPILYPAAGPEWADQLRAWEPLADFLRGVGAKLRPRVSYSQDELAALIDGVETRWNSLSEAGKSVVTNLQAFTEGHTIASVAFAAGECSVVEFANAVLAATPLHHLFGISFYQAIPPAKQHSETFRHYKDLARVCADYLAFFPQESVSGLVEAGESATLEFKSTLRWDLRQNKKNDEITYAVLKTIAAFANTEGGCLLLGVADDGRAIGIESDNFQSEDKYLLHLTTMIKTTMGTNVAALVQSEFDVFEGKRVCVVRCRKSGEPVYLKMKGGDERFFIRTGPSSAQLSPSELVSYMRNHFQT
jgi:rubredoxin